LIWFKSGTPPGHFFWPVNYPLYGAILTLVLGNPIFSLQFISILSLIFTFIYLARIIYLVYNNSANIPVIIYLATFFILSPFIFRAAIVDMSDLLCLFFITGFFFYSIAFKQQRAYRYFYLAVFFGASAVMTRYGAIVILIVPSIFMLNDLQKRFKVLGVATGILILSLCIAPHFILHRDEPTSFLLHPWLTNWNLKNLFLMNFDTPDGEAQYTVINILYSFSGLVFPGFIFAGIFFLAILLRKRGNITGSVRTIIISYIAYSLFLGGIPFQNMRFILLAFPHVLILFYPSYRQIFNLITKQSKLVQYSVFMLVLLVQFALIYRAFVPFYNENKEERAIALYLKGISPFTIYTLDLEGALHSYNIINPIQNLYYHELDSITTPSYAILDKDAFEKQWAGKTPMHNWERIKKHKLSLIKRFNNWEVYEIQ